MSEKQERITIQEAETGQVLATAVYPDQVAFFEATWYFDVERVDMTHLVISDRTYTCPYKGTCYWIDLETSNRQIRDIAFTYFDTPPEYNFIKDKIGFLSGRRQHTTEISEPAAREQSHT